MRLQHILFIAAIFAFSFTNANNGVSIKTVVIDAGHGGKDPGASGPGKTHEKDVALVVALKVGDYIQRNFPDINVIYTRKTDVFLELHERAEVANQAKADLFIAIHCNASPNDEAYGTSTYVLGLHRTEANLEVAKRENAVILMEENRDKNYEFDPNSPEGHIIMSMKQNAFLDQSIDFASKVENQLENYSKRKSLGVKQAGFYVLYKTTMPSLLAEIGFISNVEEEKFLNSVKGQDLIATGLFNAFKDYKSEIEGSNSLVVANEAEIKTTPTSSTKPATSTEIKTEKPVTENKTTTTVTKEVKTEKPKVETKPTTTQAKTEKPAIENKPTTTSTKPAETSSAQNAVTIKSGKSIRKPIENSSGGGRGGAASSSAKGEEFHPIYVTASNLNPFDTTSMGAMNNKTQKASTVKTETRTEAKGDTAFAEEIKPTKKTEVKVAAESKPEKKTETKTEVKTEKKVEPKLIVAETKTTNEAETSAGKSPLVPAHKTENGTLFKIQLFALKGELKEYEKISKLFNTLSAEELPNGFTRYYAGNSKTYSEAKQILNLALNNGYKTSAIIGFKDGNRIGAEQMKAFEGK